MDEITVLIKSQFGKDRIFPVCAKAKLFCEIAGSKSLTMAQIEKIKQLGYSVKVAPEVSSL